VSRDLVTPDKIDKIDGWDLVRVTSSRQVGKQSVYLVDASRGVVTLMLPPAQKAQNHPYSIKKIDASAYAVQVQAPFAQTIDGALLLQITTQWEDVTLLSDGRNYYRVVGFTAGSGGGGTVTSVAAGTGLSATPSPIVGAGTIKLADTAVTPASYGDASHVATFTVNQQGQLTAAGTAAITAAGIGAVPTTRTISTTAPLTGGGDLSADRTLAITAAALTKADDTNVTLTLGGTPTSALLAATSLTLGWTGTLGLARGGTAADLSATGGTSQYLKQAALGAAVTVGTIPASDIASGAALTRVNDTNVTLTLGGTPTTALLAAASLTLGWSGQLGLSRGGSNADLSATGGTGQYVKQSTLGGAFTVGTIAAADVPSATAIAGDVTGTLAATTVAKINGVAYNADPLTQYLLLAGRTGTTNNPTLSTSVDGTLTGSTTTAKKLILQGNSADTHPQGSGIQCNDNLLVFPTAQSFTSTPIAIQSGTGILTLSSNASATYLLTQNELRFTATPASGRGPQLFANICTIRAITNPVTMDQRTFWNAPSYIADGVTLTLLGGAGSFYDQVTFNTANSGAFDASAGYTAFTSGCAVTAGTIVTRTGFQVLDASGGGSITTQVGISLVALAKGTNNYGIKSAITSSANNYFLQDTGGAGSQFIGLLYRSYTPTSQTIAMGYYSIFAKRQQWTGSQRLTVKGTARLRGV